MGVSNEEPKTTKKTPYQGTFRTFGLFFCPNCDRQWGSCHSWANMGQQCRECLINVYPKRQWRLKKPRRPSADGINKVHPIELCEKCKLVGGHCRSSGVFPPTTLIKSKKSNKKGDKTSSTREP